MPRIRTVLCPIDFGELCDRSVQLAVKICRLFGARLVLHHNLDVRPPNYLSVAWMWSETHEREEEEKALEVPERLERLFDKVPDDIQYEAKITRGPMDTSLLYLAEQLPADLVVMGCGGRTSAEHQSLTELVIVKSRCPVLTIEDECACEHLLPSSGGDEGAGQAVVPIDFTPRSLGALEYAIGLATDLPLDLHLLHVVKSVQSPSEASLQEREISAAEERLRRLVPEGFGGRIAVKALAGEAPVVIREFTQATGADLVVMASHGKNLLQRWISGTTTMEILHGSNCPTWFVPGVWRELEKESRRTTAAAVM